MKNNIFNYTSTTKVLQWTIERTRLRSPHTPYYIYVYYIYIYILLIIYYAILVTVCRMRFYAAAGA